MRVLRLAAWIVACAASSTPAFAGAADTASAARAMRAPTSRPVLPFVADDYTRAVAEARARKVPLFIEAWAPW